MIESGDVAVLVWTAAGKLTKSQPIRYRRTGILTWRDGRVVRFATIRDSAVFVRGPAST